MKSEIINSTEKTTSHTMVNRILFPWIKRLREGRVITMPANSGRHENLILEQIKASGNQINLFTCDRKFKARETNIQPHKNWKQHKVGDVFEWLLTNDMYPEPTAIWFDLCGSLSPTNLEGITNSVIHICGNRSLLFVTLCVHGARGLSGDSFTKKIYEHADSPELRTELTEEILKVRIAPFKPIKALREPYIYRRASATFAVFFLSIN